MAKYSPIPIIQQLDGNGAPYAGGLLYTYAAGGTDPKDTYTDTTGGTANSNPVVADSDGRFTVCLGTGAYKFIFTDGEGATVKDPGTVEGNVIWTMDNISAYDSDYYLVETYGDLAALTPTADTFAIVAGYNTVNDGNGGLYFYDFSVTTWYRLETGEVDVAWFGATGDGTTDDTDAFLAAEAYAIALNKSIVARAGSYNLVTDPLLTCPIKLERNAMLKWSGYNPTITPLIHWNDTTRHFYCATADAPVLNTDILVRPEWFGTAGDGASDDVIPLQTAIDSMSTNGGKLHLSCIHVVGDSLYLYDYVRIDGNGTLKCDASTTIAGGILTQAETGTALQGVQIEGITIDGNKANTGSCIGININAEYSVIRTVTFKNIDTMALTLLSTGTNTFVYENTFTGCDYNITMAGSYRVLTNNIDGSATQLVSQVFKSDLDVDGNLTVTTDLVVEGDSTVVDISGNEATFVNINTDTMTLDTIYSNFVADGDVEINGDLIVNSSIVGNTVIEGDLEVQGSVSITGAYKSPVNLGHGAAIEIIASADAIDITTTTDIFNITGTHLLKTMKKTGRYTGAIVHLAFDDVCRIYWNQTAAGEYAGFLSKDDGTGYMSTLANSTYSFVYDSTNAKWRFIGIQS